MSDDPTLKEVFEFLYEAEFDSTSRHGNATVGGLAIGLTAILTFGWSQGKSLSQRFSSACDAATRVCTAADVVTSRQGLFAALAACGETLVQRIRNVLVSRLQAPAGWRIAGRPSFAVDVSLLRDFRRHGKLKIRKGLVLYWPQRAIDGGDPQPEDENTVPIPTPTLGVTGSSAR